MSTHLTDFGIARLATTGSRYTRTGEALGTPSYMSPEQARGEVHALGPPTDVWSLGCVLYELLAGRTPFEGDTPAAVVGHVITGTHTPLPRLRPDLPRDLCRVLDAALSKVARTRYPSARELRDDLDRVLRGERVRPPASRRVGAVVAAVAAAGAVVAALVWPGERLADSATPPPRAAESDLVAARALARRTADPASALAGLREALRLAPGRHDWRLTEGLLCWALGRSAEARDALGAVPPGAREYPRARLWLGIEGFSRLDGDAAAAGVQPLLDRQSPETRIAAALMLAAGHEWAKARALLGRLDGWEVALVRGYVEHQDSAGDRDLAEQSYARALAEGIPIAWIHFNRGNLRRSRGDLAGSRADFEAALRLQPDLWDARVRLIQFLEEAGDLPGARAAADAFVAEHPEQERARNVRAKILLRLRDHAGARADLEAVLAAHPDDGTAWFNLAMALEELGDHAGAESALGHAVASPDKRVEALIARATLRLSAGEPDAALADADAAVRAEPANAHAWFVRGNVRRGREESAAAMADYGEALTRDPELVLAWYSRGQIHYTGGDFPSARADFDRYLKLVPDDADARVTRACLRNDMGDAAGALADAAEAVRKDPRLARAQRVLGDFALAAGDRQTAATAYREALRLDPSDERGPELRAALDELARDPGR